MPVSVAENITHIAETDENRGRIVLQLSGLGPHPIAIAAVLWIARAFGASLESVFVEDEQLLDCAGYGFIKEISLCGQTARAISSAAMTDDLGVAFRAARRDIERAALRAGVPHHARVVRGEPLRAVAKACLERGPWNVVALADPVRTADVSVLRSILRQMPGATGVVLVGASARRVDGPIIVAIEDAGRLAQKLKLAERLAAEHSTPIVILPIGARAEQLDILEAQIRLVLDNQDGISIAACAVTLGSPAAAADILRRHRPGLVIAELGRIVVPDDSEFRALIMSLECPLFLVR